MKLTAAILLFFLASASASSYAQNTLLDISSDGKNILELFREIEGKSEFYFFYQKEDLKEINNVSVDVKNATVMEILDKALVGTNLQYKVVDRYIVVRKSGDNFGDNIIAAQQQRSVSGTVTDDTGQPLPGVTVVIKGTTQGTVTNVDGEYSIPNLPENAVLQFSFVGMRAQEVAVGNQISIDVTMKEDMVGIDEVVAIGYGTLRKSDLTGSVASITMNDNELQLPNTSIIESLHGTVAGLNVGAIQTAGDEPSLSVRGYNTLSTSSSANSPLIVVDGVIYRGNLIDLNTHDIASIDVLKDASSAAIYGSQASNGVILITTRKGKVSSKPVFNYSGEYSLQVPYNEIVPMNRDELEKFINDANWQKGSRLAPDYLQPDPGYSFAPYLKSTEIRNGYENGINNDWWNMFVENGFNKTQNLSVQGNNENIGYFVSSGYTNQKGFAENDNYKKYNHRINLDIKINNWLSIGTQSFLTTSDYSGVSPDAARLFSIQPWAPIYEDDGNYLLTPDGSSLGPFQTIEQEDFNKRLQLVGTAYANVKLPFIKGLNYKINYSQNLRVNTHDNFNPYGSEYTGSGYKNFSKVSQWSLDNIVTYNRTFKDIHRIDLTLVYGVEEVNTSYTNSSAQNFSNKLLGYNSLQAGDPTLFQIRSGAEKETSLYTSARLFYGFNNKYLVTGTIRKDGYSGFGTNEKMGLFPSIALGWIISNEGFLKNDWMNHLKLRASYGTSGRRAVSRYDTKAVVSSHPSYIFGDGGSALIGQYISKMANNDLGWETTTGMNLGVDFGFMNSRLLGNIEYYSNQTDNSLYNIQLPYMTGFSSIPYNIGKVQNHGIEFSLTGNIISTKDLSWKASVNYSRIRNEIISVLGPTNDQNQDGIEDDLVANHLFIGQPQNVIYDYEITGENWQLTDNIPSGFLPGTKKIVDLNDDGEYSANNDRKILGYSDPSYLVGISSTLQYKNFNFYVFINSIQGGKDYYKGKVDPAHAFTNVELITQRNGPSGTFDYWMPENPDAKYRRLDTAPSYEGFHYDQRNFIRLQDVTLSYTFKDDLIHKLSISKLKVFLSGKNLWTITKWEGLDPELGIGISPDFPIMSSYSMGINIEF